LSSAPVRVLLIADTHLGFDLPFRPRVSRRRRGRDFFANFERALSPALRGEVDLLVHGGDLFYRSGVPAALIDMVFSPLVKVAEQGVPVFLVPGNHERSRIPLHLWSGHPGIHIFDEPRTFLCPTPGGTISLSGFPFSRRVRDSFGELVSCTGHSGVGADIRLLCMHQTVEGAQVGPSDFTFRCGPDVVRGSRIPTGFAALLCGHIHRSQLLTRDVRGRKLAAPVIYAGSVERTSFAERCEPKHYVLAEFEAVGSDGGHLSRTSFVSLPARPMVSLDVFPQAHDRAGLVQHLRRQISRLDPDSVVRVRLSGESGMTAPPYLTAAWLRSLAPATMNISLAPHRRAAAEGNSAR